MKVECHFLINATLWFVKQEYKLDNPSIILQYIYSPTNSAIKCVINIKV